TLLMACHRNFILLVILNRRDLGTVQVIFEKCLPIGIELPPLCVLLPPDRFFLSDFRFDRSGVGLTLSHLLRFCCLPFLRGSFPRFTSINRRFDPCSLLLLSFLSLSATHSSECFVCLLIGLLSLNLCPHTGCRFFPDSLLFSSSTLINHRTGTLEDFLRLCVSLLIIKFKFDGTELFLDLLYKSTDALLTIRIDPHGQIEL